MQQCDDTFGLSDIQFTGFAKIPACYLIYKLFFNSVSTKHHHISWKCNAHHFMWKGQSSIIIIIMLNEFVSVGIEDEGVECVCGTICASVCICLCQHDLKNLTAGSWVDCRVQSPALTSLTYFPHCFDFWRVCRGQAALRTVELSEQEKKTQRNSAI